MRNVNIRSIANSIIEFNEVRSDSVELIIHGTNINGFIINYDPPPSDVDDIEDITESRLVNISPNPVIQNINEINLQFDVQRAGNVSIELFDVLGNKVVTILDEYYPAGKDHIVKFNLCDMKGSKLSTGTYTVRMKTGVKTSQKQLIVVN
jgi:hypothetical protein